MITMEVDVMKRGWKVLLLCILVPLLVGGLSGWLTRGSMEAFEQMNKPPLAPPGWLFPVVWTVLFLLMGLASYLVLALGEDRQEVEQAIRVYGIQLAVNFFWSILFFNLGLCYAAFVWLVLLWGLVLITAVRFFRIVPLAGYLLIPYILWITFAGYLNLSICLLN